MPSPRQGNVMLNLQVPRELHHEFKTLATKNRESMTKILNYYIRKYVAQKQKSWGLREVIK